MLSNERPHDPLQPQGLAFNKAAGVSVLVTAVFFAFFIGILHPGYAINDDIKIIAIAAGYPGVQPSPFLIFSNIVLGFLLVALYKAPSTVNWEIMLFLIVDGISLCILLYFVASSQAPRPLRALGAGLLLACASYYPLKITFTSTAGLACSAGLLAILAGATKGRVARTAIAIGVVLSFMGSLIRLEMLAIAAPLALAYAVTFYRAISWRIAVMALGCAGLLVFAGYALDDLYVRAHNDWQAFYAYSTTAQALQDSHRLENLHSEIRRIGWSKNDQEVFARYFYPDAGTYSLERLQYLVDHVPGASQNPRFVLEFFAQRILAGRAVAALIGCLSAWFLILGIGNAGSARQAVPLATAAVLIENLGLMWIYKSPDYVFMSTLSNAALVSVVFVFLPGISPPADRPRRAWPRMAILAGLITSAVAIGLSLQQSLSESSQNRANEMAYVQILNDVDQLRQNGNMARNAIVLSASHGIPWHWANPLWIRFPSFTYLDTGWITFSPYYNEALRAHNLQPVLDSIVTGDRVYWTSKPVFQGYLARFVEEHEGGVVRFLTLYHLPDSNQPDGERGIELYKVVPAPDLVPQP
jgi:hypothetical protein